MSLSYRRPSLLSLCVGSWLGLWGCAVADLAQEMPDAFPGRADATSRADAQPERPDSGTAACTAALANLRFDFEGGAQGFVHNRMPEVASAGTSWTFDQWQQGRPSTPITCASGQECFGTNLSGNYIQCQRAYLVSPVIDLSACSAIAQPVTLRFEHRYDFWTGNYGGTPWYDGGRVEISGDGLTWQSATLLYPGTIDINPERTPSFACLEKNKFYVDGKEGYVGSSSGWKSESFVIPETLATLTFQLRFVYGAGVSSKTSSQAQSMSATAAGWFIDQIRFE